MPKAHINYESFNGGEISPLLSARVTIAKWQNSLQKCLNFIPLVQGGLVRRSGTMFVSTVRDQSKEAKLIPFEFSTEQAYIIETQETRMRFYKDYGLITSGGNPYVLVSPYGAGAALQLKYDQANDVMTLCHPLYPPYYLKRFAHDDWLLEKIPFNPAPFGKINTSNITLTASATTGTVTFTSSAPLINFDHIDAQIKFTEITAAKYDKWEAGVTIEDYDVVSNVVYRRYENKVYVLKKKPSGGTAEDKKTGKNPPIHDKGIESDGVQDWEYIDDGIGIVRVLSIVNDTTFTAEVLKRLPRSVRDTNTIDYYLPVWYVKTFPSSSIYFQGRHYFATGQRIDGSVINEYENFANKNVDGDLTDEMAVSYTFDAKRANLIEWLEENERGLTAGTSGGEYAILSTSGEAAITPNNPPSIKQVSQTGCASLQPVRAGNALIFVQRAKKSLFEFLYTVTRDGFGANNLNLFATHLFNIGIAGIAFQRQPYPILWCHTETQDGRLFGLTYDKEQEVFCWHQHIIGGYSAANQQGQARVESIAVIPSPDGDREDLWMVVRRYINGGTRRYIEVMKPLWNESQSLNNAWQLDSALEYNGSPTTFVTGLSHLDGETVGVFADSQYIGDRYVSNGRIELNGTYSKVVAGLKYNSVMETFRPEGGSLNGVSQGKIHRVNKVMVDFYRSVGGQYNDPVEPLTNWIPIENDGNLFTGIKELQWPGNYGFSGRIGIAQTEPLPMIIRAIYAEMQTND